MIRKTCMFSKKPKKSECSYPNTAPTSPAPHPFEVTSFKHSMTGMTSHLCYVTSPIHLVVHNPESFPLPHSLFFFSFSSHCLFFYHQSILHLSFPQQDLIPSALAESHQISPVTKHNKQLHQAYGFKSHR